MRANEGELDNVIHSDVHVAKPAADAKAATAENKIVVGVQGGGR